MLLSLWLTALLTMQTVVVEGRALDASALSIVVASCDEAFAGACVAAELPASHERADQALHVVLRADDNLTTVQADVLQGGHWLLSRTLQLEASASREERARAIGLVVAAQALAMQPGVPHPRTPATPPAVPGAQTYRLDGAAWLGSALDRGPPRLGLLLRGSWLSAQLPLGLVASVRGAYRPDAVRVGWASVSAGLVGRYAWSRALALEARLEAVGQRTEAGATDQGRRAHTGTLRWGALVGLDLLWQLREHLALFAGLEGTLLGPEVVLYVRGRALGNEPLLGWTSSLGVRHGW